MVRSDGDDYRLDCWQRDFLGSRSGMIWGGTAQYSRDPDKTTGTYRGECLTLGDVGHLDDGYLFLTDRSLDLIISSGVNVYPAEVEGELLAHPAVADAAVIGIPTTAASSTVSTVVAAPTDRPAMLTDDHGPRTGRSGMSSAADASSKVTMSDPLGPDLVAGDLR